MTHLDAVRNFANPGFSPARRVVIYDSKWYLCTMQNVDHDGLTDYIGLGEGEYRELLPGKKARERKFARLNHCNGIQIWTGPVFRLQAIRWGRADRDPSWTGTPEGIAAAQQALQAEYLDHLQALDESEARTRAELAAGFAGWQARHPAVTPDRWPEQEAYLQHSLQNNARAKAAAADPWRIQVTQER